MFLGTIVLAHYSLDLSSFNFDPVWTWSLMFTIVPFCWILWSTIWLRWQVSGVEIVKKLIFEVTIADETGRIWPGLNRAVSEIFKFTKIKIIFTLILKLQTKKSVCSSARLRRGLKNIYILVCDFFEFLFAKAVGLVGRVKDVSTGNVFCRNFSLPRTFFFVL